MDCTTILSLSWREGGAELLSSCTVPVDQRPELLKRLAHELSAEEVVYIGTCNRVELAYRSLTPPPVNEARKLLMAALDPNGNTETKDWRAWQGEGAVEHLLLLACGLASANLGETEISGQLRESTQLSRELGLAGGHLEDFIEEALRCAKRVRRESSIAEGRTSLAEIALERVAEQRDGLAGKQRVVLLGRSAMTERIARSLDSNQTKIYWVNRTPERLQVLAKEYGANVVSLGDYLNDPIAADVIVSATGSAEPLMEVSHLTRAKDAGTRLVIDLSVSPDIRQADAEACGLAHFGLDEILRCAEETRSEKELAAADARILVDEALEQLLERSRSKEADVAASHLYESFKSQASQTAKIALGKELKHLDDEDAKTVMRFADLLARKLAHGPAKGLKRLAAKHGRAAAMDFIGVEAEEKS